MAESVLYEVGDHIATITLNRPEVRNALNYDAYQRLEEAFRNATRDDQVRCVILTGSDPAFCSGDDVREIMAGPDSFVTRANEQTVEPSAATMAALECDKPIIAAVNGAAVGWGMELALFANIRIASEKARFAELFIKRGIICDIPGFCFLPSIVGASWAAELLFTGDAIGAEDAARIGLVREVTPHGELMERARDLAGRIAVNPPLALRRTKEGLRRAANQAPHEVGAWAIKTTVELMRTDDHREGVASFLEKRAPIFKGG